MHHTRSFGIRALLAPVVLLVLGLGTAQAASGDQPVKPLPEASKPKSSIEERKASLPAKGLFVGDQLSASAKDKLTELILNALGLEVQVALVVPTGPWQIDGSGKDERDLTPARLNAVKKFLHERGVDPTKIYVESRIDQSLSEPRLDLQLMGRPAND
jgi:OOP family OmpA-OmpF porin